MDPPSSHKKDCQSWTPSDKALNPRRFTDKMYRPVSDDMDSISTNQPISNQLPGQNIPERVMITSEQYQPISNPVSDNMDSIRTNQPISNQLPGQNTPEKVTLTREQYQAQFEGISLFHCGYCGKFFRHKSKYDVHLRKHTGEKPFVCSKCGKGFAHNSNLNKHMQHHI